MSPKAGLYIGAGVSAGIVVIAAVVIATIISQRESIGAPTAATTAPGFLDKMTLDLDLAKLIALPPATGNGAEATYQAAMKDVAAQGDTFAVTVDVLEEPAKDPVCKGILDKVEAAADQGLADKMLNFDAALPLTPATEWTEPRSIYNKLDAVRIILSRTALQEQDKGAAEKVMRAELIWGDRLFSRGEYVVYKSAALTCIGDALGLYQTKYGAAGFNDPGKVAAAKALYDQYLPVGKRWNKKEVLLRTVSPGPAIADVWNLAEHDRDHAWQLEGLMWLGIGQWTWSEGPQRTAVQKYLAQKATSTDPLIAQFAKTAHDTKRAGAGDFAR
jgi:hypothetical protein